MRAGLARWALILAAGAGLPAPADAQPAPEAPGTTAEERTRRLFGPFGLHLFPLEYERRGSAIERLRETREYLVRPRASNRPGICKTDHLRIEFDTLPRPVLIGEPAIPPERPGRIALHTEYFVHDLARAQRAEPMEVREQLDLDAACAALDPRQVRRIGADSEFQVSIAVELLTDLVAAARAGRPLAPLDCSAVQSDGQPMTETECLRFLRGFSVDQVYYVRTCPGPTQPPGFACYQLLTLGFEIDFEHHPGVRGPARILVRRPREDPPF